MKSLTTSIYTFENLIEGKYFYVDKTEYIWNLIKQPYGIYFLSRPRRFGKSLTLSTLKAVFQNKENLFEGLALKNKGYEWKKYPVIHLDLMGCPASSAKELNESLKNALDSVAVKYGAKLSGNAAHLRFSNLIRILNEQDKVVILIDEYDKPILDNVTAKNVEEIRRVLEDFYSVIKATQHYQRFVLLTGVSKFSTVSAFSKLNNLTDITMYAQYSTMLGYTQNELETNFAEYIAPVVKEQGIAEEKLLKQLKEWYGGYRFAHNGEAVYNPVSIGKFFESGGMFMNYWFETGTPSFLIDLLKNTDYNIRTLDNLELDELGFASYELTHLAPEPLLIQTGYLTIKAYDQNTELYTLGYPNLEVENAFMRYLMDAFSPVRKELAASHIVRLYQAVEKGDVDQFMEHLKVFFSGIPNNIALRNEKYYQTIFYLVFKIIGIYISAEVNTNKGRIDAVAETTRFVFIFEFKLQGTADEALQQIHDKEYYQMYLNSKKQVMLIGAAFDKDTRNIEAWKTSKITQKLRLIFIVFMKPGRKIISR